MLTEEQQAMRLYKREATRKYNERHPERARAHAAITNAITAGRILRQPCQICGNPKSEGHHEDYERPFYIAWLCRKHHIARHRQMKLGLPATVASLDLTPQPQLKPVTPLQPTTRQSPAEVDALIAKHHERIQKIIATPELYHRWRRGAAIDWQAEGL